MHYEDLAMENNLTILTSIDFDELFACEVRLGGPNSKNLVK